MTDNTSLPGITQRLDLEHITRSEFITAMMHLHPVELGEATAWRSRIDTTTHWAVVWIYAILLGSWVLVLTSHPTPSSSLTDVGGRASIGPLSGQFVMAGMLVFYGALVALSVYSFWNSHSKKSLPAGHPGRLLSVAHHEEA